MIDKRRAMFVGRWQPMHDGHKWLIEQKLEKGIPILICVRDIPPDNKNPFTTQQTVEMIEKVYEEKDVKVITIPDIESVNWGRGVGYETNEHKPPENIGFVSATQIRDSIEKGADGWKKNVDERIHEQVISCLRENRFLK
jgi:adenylylsulfate kinase